MKSVRDALLDARKCYPTTESRGDKKNFAEAFSRNLSTCFANALRSDFPGISPDADGKKQEKRARTAKGFKKLDVNYSTVELGLALGVSIKTINAKDPSNQRYTKNYGRVDNELRAEATDYHKRQPYAVLVAVIFLPFDSCQDASKGRSQESGVSSFGAVVKFFRPRGGRQLPSGDLDLFERVYIGLYEPGSGDVFFFDVYSAPPKAGSPRAESRLTFEAVVERIRATYDERNKPDFSWDDESPSPT